MRSIRIATRGSRLALIQSRRVATLLRESSPHLAVSFVEVTTSGDLDPSGRIAELTETGAFVRSVQEAVIDGHADLAVHSLKDLPVEGPEELVLAAIPERLAPNDVLVGSTLSDLAPGATVGTGSPRRSTQLALMRSDLRTTDLRGNVETRLRKIEHGEVDAAVLAAAGLERLGLSSNVSQRLDVGRMVPAPGQGALAVEGLAGGEATEIARGLDDPRLRPLVTAERDLLGSVGAGCRSALGALAGWERDLIRLDVFLQDQRGPRRVRSRGETPERAAAAALEELGL